MARTSIPWALRSVKASTAVPSASLPKAARVTPGWEAGGAAGACACVPATLARTRVAAIAIVDIGFMPLLRDLLVLGARPPDNSVVSYVEKSRLFSRGLRVSEGRP